MRTSLTITYPSGSRMRTHIEVAEPVDRDAVLRMVQPFLEGRPPTHVRLGAPMDQDMFIAPGSARGRNDYATVALRAWLLHQTPGVDPSSLPSVDGIAVLFDRRVVP